MPYRKSRSRKLETVSGGLLEVIRLRGASFGRRQHPPEWPDQFCELERQDILRRGAGPQALERIEVLEQERFLINPFGGPEDRGEGLGVSFGVQDRGLSRAL